MRCFFCDVKGYVKSECLERKEWFARKNFAIVVVAEKVVYCLCIIFTSFCGDLSRIFIDVRSDEE